MSDIKNDEVREIKTKEMKQRDSFARHYDTQISDYPHKIEIASATKKLSPKEGEYILDLGCGTGRITYELIEAGCKILCVDFSKESLKVCEQRCGTLHTKNNLYLIQADVCKIPLKDGYFDKCISSEVLEHILKEKEGLGMLHEIYRVLKFNSKLVLTTYNHNLRKIIGRKREMKKSELFIYRYDYFKLKKFISFVFRGKIKIVGILNLIHWVPPNVLNKFERFCIPIDKFIEKTPFSYLLAHLLSVECKKTNNDKK